MCFGITDEDKQNEKNFENKIKPKIDKGYKGYRLELKNKNYMSIFKYIILI